MVLLSATMPSDVLEVTKRFMRDPIQILVKKEELTLEGIRQFYIQVGREVSRGQTSGEGWGSHTQQADFMLGHMSLLLLFKNKIS